MSVRPSWSLGDWAVFAAAVAVAAAGFVGLLVWSRPVFVLAVAFVVVGVVCWRLPNRSIRAERDEAVALVVMHNNCAVADDRAEVKQVEMYDQDAPSAQVNLVERPSDNPVRCPDGGVCAYAARGLPNCDEQCAVLLADDDEAREFLAEIRPERLCDNRCGQPARWVWDDGVPHAACDQDVELWWPDGIDLLVVTDLTAVDPSLPPITHDDIEVMRSGFRGYEGCPSGDCTTPFHCSERGDCRRWPEAVGATDEPDLGRTAEGHDVHSLGDMRWQLNEWGDNVREVSD